MSDDARAVVVGAIALQRLVTPSGHRLPRLRRRRVACASGIVHATLLRCYVATRRWQACPCTQLSHVHAPGLGCNSRGLCLWRHTTVTVVVTSATPGHLTQLSQRLYLSLLHISVSHTCIFPQSGKHFPCPTKASNSCMFYVVILDVRRCSKLTDDVGTVMYLPSCHRTQ